MAVHITENNNFKPTKNIPFTAHFTNIIILLKV